MEQMSEAAISNLLKRTSQIRHKHELVAELTGENFNVFRILGLQASENRTHSAFLRELLDPQGTHGMGDAFLKAFIRLMRSWFKGVKAFKMDEKLPIMAKVVTELHLGYKSEDLTNGGRVDLAITPPAGGWRIFIENKIYAGDQECQLVRYQNGDPSATLLYLTLNEKEASEFSTKNLVNGKTLEAGVDYLRISYSDHILKWLEVCAKEASGRPLVRETIVQYAHLIRYLTHQNSSNLMTNDITDIVLSDKEALLSYAALYASWDTIRTKMLNSIVSELKLLAEQENFAHSETFINLIVGDTKIRFVDDLLKMNNLAIEFGHEEGKWFYGYSRLNAENPAPAAADLKALETSFLKTEQFGEMDIPNTVWPVSSYWLKYPIWLWDQKLLADVYFEKSPNIWRGGTKVTLFVEDISTLLKAMRQIAHEVFKKY